MAGDDTMNDHPTAPPNLPDTSTDQTGNARGDASLGPKSLRLLFHSSILERDRERDPDLSHDDNDHPSSSILQGVRFEMLDPEHDDPDNQIDSDNPDQVSLQHQGRFTVPAGLQTPSASSASSLDVSPPRLDLGSAKTRSKAAPQLALRQGEIGGRTRQNDPRTPPPSADLPMEVTGLKPCSSGAVSWTYEGRLPTLDIPVVIKIIPADKKRFAINEAKVYNRIKSRMAGKTPRYLGLYKSYASCSETFYAIVTEYAGQSLSDRNPEWFTLGAQDRCVRLSDYVGWYKKC